MNQVCAAHDAMLACGDDILNTSIPKTKETFIFRRKFVNHA